MLKNLLVASKKTLSTFGFKRKKWPMFQAQPETVSSEIFLSVSYLVSSRLI